MLIPIVFSCIISFIFVFEIIFIVIEFFIFIGKVGDDYFGRLLKERIEKQGIGTAGLVMDSTVPTTLAFVNKLANGDRDFFFTENRGQI